MIHNRAPRSQYWLANRSAVVLSVWCATAAFITYFSMYAYRKPFTAATYDDQEIWGVPQKTALVVAQLAGYTLSKFIGIRWVSELDPARRAGAILGLVGVAQLALVLFAMVPTPWNCLALFINGLPLGMIFGLVLGYLEGRRVTELLTAGLCASFIISSGVVKSVGQSLILYGSVSEYWMPALTGLLFTPVLMLGVWMLTQVPPPDSLDEQHRSVRVPAGAVERGKVISRHRFGLLLLVTVYVLLTVLRGIRDDFAPEIWSGLGFQGQPSVFTTSELWVTVGVLAINGAGVMIVDNRWAFRMALFTVVLGFCCLLAAVIGFRLGWLSGYYLMVLGGLGAYLPYVAYHTALFERLIAVFRDRTNLAHLMYVADSAGYLGYVGVLAMKTSGIASHNFLELYMQAAVWIAPLCLLLVAGTMVHYERRMSVSYRPVTDEVL